MYFYLLFSSLNIGYFVYKWGILGTSYTVLNTTKHVYTFFKSSSKNISKSDLYQLLEEQSKMICDLNFKIQKLENPETNHGYELI
jgi:hypothetical protein